MFRTKHTFFWSIQSIALFGACLTFSDTLEVRDLLIDGSEKYVDYEIFGIDEGLEEDIVYITQRAPVPNSQSCSDCDYFQPWDESDLGSLLKRDDSLWTLERGNTTLRHLMSPRDGGNVKSKTIQCPQGGEVTVQSYRYPKNEDLDKMNKNQIYDFEPFDKPDQASYYKLQATKAFQNRNGAGMSVNRAVSVEHILEWQVLIEFIEADAARCKHIAGKAFTEPIQIDTMLNVIDDSGKTVLKRKETKESAIDWVAHQYPGTESAGSYFSYEFVSLHDGVNGRKEKLWSKGTSSAKKPKSVVTKPDLVEKTKWNKWTVENKYQQESPSKTGSKRKSKTWTASTNNEGRCHAIVALRDIIGVYRYHSTPAVQKILDAQVKRIGTAFKYLEEGPLKTLKTTKYTPMATSLESQWNTFMKAKYASVISTIDSTMKELSADLEKSKVKRGWLDLVKRGAGSTTGPLCGQEKDKKKLNERIALLLKEYEEVKGKWKNSMP